MSAALIFVLALVLVALVLVFVCSFKGRQEKTGATTSLLTGKTNPLKS